MNELCLLSGLTSSEWAAWVQAIGSVAAIAAAVWIMNRQHKIAEMQETKRRLDRMNLLEKMVSELIRRLHQNEGLFEETDGTGAFTAYANTLQVRLDAVHSIPLQEIQSPEVIAQAHIVLHWIGTLVKIFDEASTQKRSKETLQALKKILDVHFSTIDEEHAELTKQIKAYREGLNA